MEVRGEEEANLQEDEKEEHEAILRKTSFL
jgi:hypothetical protein